MSASSVRRIKERGGGTSKVTATIPQSLKPSKTLMPVSLKSSTTISGGKENPRPTSRIRAASTSSLQKPSIRSLPKIDRSAAAVEIVEPPRIRQSTSSVTRVRSSSPSAFTRVFSDLRKNNNINGNNDYNYSNNRISSRVSLGDTSDKGGIESVVSVRSLQKKGNLKGLNVKQSENLGNVNRVLKCLERSGEIRRELGSNRGENEGFGIADLEEIGIIKGGFRGLNEQMEEKCEIGIRVLKEPIGSGKCQVGLEKSTEICNDVGLKSEENGDFAIRVMEECKQEVNLSSAGKKTCIERDNDEGNLDKNVKLSDSVGGFKEFKGRSSSVERSRNGGNLGFKESGGKLSNRVIGSEMFKEKGINKYPSKLHEKLAFLEGKVKRIASDIKRTKEMLDLNNPDASKVVLSDIQEKISGIEKAMGNVVNGDDGKMGLVKATGNDNLQVKASVKNQDKQEGQRKNSVKGLNTEELEARFFPHHKLLRDRTSVKTSPGSSRDDEDKLVASTAEVKVEEKSSSPIDENSIALEFLASLNREQSMLILRGGNDGAEIYDIQEMDGAVTSAAQDSSSNTLNRIGNLELVLTTDERLEEFEDQENKPAMVIEDEIEDNSIFQLNEIGRKTSTGGWFVSEGESVLLAHDDGSCSFYDIANCEEKAEYRPPVGVSPNAWRDCWMIRAPCPDGCSGRYVVAASAGNAMESGFCSWDFYTKDVRAFHLESGISNTRTALAPLPNNSLHRRNSSSSIMVPEPDQWWYKPCGPLIISTASSQRVVRIYDIRDGEQVMKWEVQKPVLGMDFSSPLQWRNRGKVVVAEGESISLWDVSSLTSQALMSVSSSGKKISALHVNNTDAELGGGVRQRVSSSEAEGHDGVFCTLDSINVLDFRHPSGVGLKIPKLGSRVQSTFSRGDSIFLGCNNLKSAGKMQSNSQVLQFSLRKQKLFSTYLLPESNAHFHYTAITQVWGNSNLVMGVCGLGLFVFDALMDDGLQSFTNNYDNMKDSKETIGPDDMYSPSFDYLASRVLLISRDRPALSRYLS